MCALSISPIYKFSQPIKTCLKRQNLDGCHLCSKPFTKKCKIKTHKLVYSGEKIHVCEGCNKNFPLKGYLMTNPSINTEKKTDHTLIHNIKEKPSEPNSEESSTQQESQPNEKKPVLYLKMPQILPKKELNSDSVSPVKNEQKSHVCEVCSKSFKMRNALRKHIVIHATDKPHKCNTCEKSFAQKAHLLKHILTHTREKPHKCDVCDKSFAQKTNLQRHITTHVGQRTYVCHYEFCKKAFTRKAILQKHMVVHEG